MDQHYGLESVDQMIGRRFRGAGSTTLVARSVSKDPIVMSHLVIEAPTGRWTEAPPPAEAAFSCHVVMTPLRHFETLIDGRHAKVAPTHAGGISLFDMTARPIALIREPTASVRFHISQRTLDDLAHDRGQRHRSALRPTFGIVDPVLHGLASAFLAKLKFYGADDQLFIDSVALAFHAHIVRAYGQATEISWRGGLAPWQVRRARELMMNHLAGGIAVADLAKACALSGDYFLRAFRQSVGTTPHKFLMNMRVARAKELLLDRDLTLPQIAMACGFSDQSHMTRVFAKQEGRTPARWRRAYRK